MLMLQRGTLRGPLAFHCSDAVMRASCVGYSKRRCSGVTGAAMKRPRGFWVSEANQKEFLDQVTCRGTLPWSRVTYETIRRAGGGTLLNRYNGSVVELLKTHYPHAEEEILNAGVALASSSGGSRDRKRRGYWMSVKHQRQFLDAFAKERGITSPKDWRQVRSIDIERAGGKRILELYPGFLAALQTIYPEQKWSRATRKSIPSAAWDEVGFCREFLSDIAKERGFPATQLAGWKEVTNKEVGAAGGGGLLRKYEGSLRAALAEAFPEAEFASAVDIDCRPRVAPSHWESQENRQAFFDDVARKLGIEQPEQWATVTTAQVQEFPGASAVLRKAKGSLHTALQDAYPQQNFDERNRVKVGQHFWASRENRKRFLEDIAEKFHVKKPEDWRKVTRLQVCQENGSGLFSIYPTLFAALEDLYPEDVDILSCRSAVPSAYWEVEENVIAFVKKLERDLQIKTRNDWCRVAQFQVKAAGGAGLLRVMSLREALELVYPEEKWEEAAWGGSKKATQRQLLLLTSGILPGVQILEDHRHPSLSRDVRDSGDLELDLFLPAHDVAVEYNGYHHYFDLPFFGPVEQYRLRDVEKRHLCEKAGIRLITIPYWWDKAQESLAATLYQEVPSLFQLYETDDALLKRIRSGAIAPIPKECPAGLTVKKEASKARNRSAAQIAGVWSGAADPAGMYACERLEGVSVRWVEGKLATRHGRVIPVPRNWAAQMPDVDCDGVLWMGDASMGRLVNVIFRTRSRSLMEDSQDGPCDAQWSAIQFVAVDVPEVGRRFVDRLAVLSSLPESGHFKIMPYTRCKDRDHLTEMLTAGSEGSGLLLRDPASVYRFSANFWQEGTLRVQQTLSTTVKVVDRAEKTRGLLVEVRDGLVQVARCSDSQYFGAAPGDSVRVGHFGQWPTGRIKHPFLY